MIRTLFAPAVFVGKITFKALEADIDTHQYAQLQRFLKIFVRMSVSNAQIFTFDSHFIFTF